MEAASLSELFPPTAAATTTKNNPNELGQEDFMTLMVAQLKNQDPSKPMDNSQFLAQIAQFGTVSGIQELQNSFGSLSSILYANQALEAANLVGRQVVTDSNLGSLASDGIIDATVDLPENATSVALYVQNESGQLVYSEELGGAARGEFKVQWDGTDGNGNKLQPGQYRISAEAFMAGKNEAVSVYTHNRVESVTVDHSGGGVVLNLTGGSKVGSTDVKSFL